MFSLNTIKYGPEKTHYFDFLEHIQTLKSTPQYRIVSIVFTRPEAYSEPYQTSEMEICAKMRNDPKLLTVFVKFSILDYWQDAEYTYDISNNSS